MNKITVAMKSESRNRTSLIFISILLAGFLSSCGPDFAHNDDYQDDPEKYSKIYMPQARDKPAKKQIMITDSTQSFIYGAAFAGPAEPNSDIPVEFSVSAALVDSFNKNNLTSHPILPKDAYTMGAMSATIPAGEMGSPPLKLKLKTQGHITEGNFLLPITMEVKGGGVPTNKDLQTTYFLFQTPNLDIDKSLWEIVEADAGLNSSYAASLMIDGDDDSIWLTVADLPHVTIVNMGKKSLIKGFRIVGHSPGSYASYTARNPKEITIQFSSDGQNWKNGEDFTLPLDSETTSTRIELSTPVTAHYFKYIINKNVGSTNISYTAEIGAF